MDAKELRLSNSIRLYLGVSDLGAEYREVTILGIQDDYGTIRIRIDQTDTWHHVSNFEAIPLTEEWLLKFGFVDFEKESFSYYIENNGEIVFKKSGLDILYDYPIQYVHQLQNLFFSLCGEELSLIN